MNEEWGPWIEHDGKGCPCVGMYVHRIFATPGRDTIDGAVKSEKIGLVTNPNSGCWHWTPGFASVIRYRVRKPRGLTILEGLIADLPAPVGLKVEA